MRIRWTKPAAKDLYRIVQRIKEDNPSAAVEVGTTLSDGCDRLKDFPRIGRNGRIEGTRELVFPRLPYIVVYRVQKQHVEILRIYNAAQNWP